MSNNPLLDILNYEVGDEVWWFRMRTTRDCLYTFALKPGEIELVHDTIKEINNGELICWHSTKKTSDIWGKTRKEAWETLKSDIEKWGALS